MNWILVYVFIISFLCMAFVGIAIANTRARRNSNEAYIWSDCMRIGFISIPWHVYGIRNDRILNQYGIVRMIDEECMLYLITDIRVERGIVQRLCGIGDIVISARDENEKKIIFSGIKNVYRTRDIISGCVDKAKNNRNEIIIR